MMDRQRHLLQRFINLMLTSMVLLVIIAACKGVETEEEVHLGPEEQAFLETKKTTWENFERLKSLTETTTETASETTTEAEKMAQIVIDPSRTFQWLINHVDSLSDEERALLFDELGLLSERTLIEVKQPKNAVYAADAPTYFEVVTLDNVHIWSEDEALLREKGGLLLAVSDIAFTQMRNYGVDIGFHEIHIELKPMLGKIHSYSVYIAGIENEEFSISTRTQGAVNTMLSDADLVGAFIHELFHAFQYEVGLDRTQAEDEWLMEATAIWWVQTIRSDLDYGGQFREALFEKPSVDMSLMDEDLQRSWFQLFEAYGTDVAKGQSIPQLIFSYKAIGLLNLAFDNVWESKETVADTFEAMIAMGMERGAFASDDILVHSEATIIDEYNGVWYDMPVDSFGMKLMKVDLTGSEANAIELMTNVSGELTARNGAMFYIEAEDAFHNALGRGHLVPTATISLEQQAIESLWVVFYSYDCYQPQTPKVSITFNTRIRGNGYIQCDIHREPLFIEGEDKLVEDYQLIIDESVLFYEPTVSPENRDLLQLILGNIYYIKEMNVVFTGFSALDKPNGDSIDVNYYGHYKYNDGDFSEGTFDQPLMMMPDPSDYLGDSVGTSLDSFLPPGMTMKEMLDMLPKEERAAMEKELNEAKEALDKAQSDLQKDNMDLFSGLLPSTQQLNRFKIDDNSYIFNIFNTFPPNITTKAWVDYQVEGTYHQADGSVKVVYSSIYDVMPSGTFLPVWFYNAYYDESQAMQEFELLPQDPLDFVENYQDLSQITDQIATMNGKWDPSNLYLLLSEGTKRIDMAQINSGYQGNQTQEITFENNQLVGNIDAEFVDEHGTYYVVHLELFYDFN